MCASCQLPRSDANPPWLVPTGNWAQTGAKQTQEGNMAHGNPPSHSSLCHPPLSTQISCFAPNAVLTENVKWYGQKNPVENRVVREVQVPAEGTEQWLKSKDKIFTL